MQASSATAQSFQEPNHSRFGVPCTSQTMSQIKLAMLYLTPSRSTALFAPKEWKRRLRRCGPDRWGKLHGWTMPSGER